MKQQRRTAWVCVGLPGSGKSTWARKKTVKGRTVIVCRDEIRTMLLGYYAVNPAAEKLVTDLSVRAVRDALKSGFDIVIDETDITRAARKRWLAFLRRTIPKIRVVFVHFTETECNLEFRMRSPKGLSRRKWASVISGMKQHFEPPRLSEGCDTILKVPRWK